MHKVQRAITAGVASTTVMSMALLIVDVQTRSELSLFDALARFFGMPGRVGRGLLIFFFFGIVVWPLLFALLFPYLPPQHDPAVKGMLLATVLWIGFVLVGTAQIDTSVVLFYLAVTLLTHLAYGFTLGAVYNWTGQPPSPDTTDNRA
ncbi:DUF6789 family protein [Halocatena pleomorpha]|uniref:Uncharacterized protein n=1 Tax=Halocatena pleomorpha TaxID=1785090 RepID=A0A3P3RDB4_9EURY|nr:DUF6789 family protein [Halocatena pleomorpha]RRJ31497.1 hypothetical protein EIK79_07230 [Halocatena pleomorpha]